MSKWLWTGEAVNEDMLLKKCLEGVSSQTRSLAALDKAGVFNADIQQQRGEQVVWSRVVELMQESKEDECNECK